MMQEAPIFGISDGTCRFVHHLLKRVLEREQVENFVGYMFYEVISKENSDLFEFIEEEAKKKITPFAYQLGAVLTYTAIRTQMILDGREVELTREELSDYKQGFSVPLEGIGLAVEEFLKETSRGFLNEVVSLGMTLSAKSRSVEDDFFQGICDVGMPFFRKMGDVSVEG